MRTVGGTGFATSYEGPKSTQKIAWQNLGEISVRQTHQHGITLVWHLLPDLRREREEGGSLNVIMYMFFFLHTLVSARCSMIGVAEEGLHFLIGLLLPVGVVLASSAAGGLHVD